MFHLLDVNILISLLDGEHIHHKNTTEWFFDNKIKWATCPITENGFIRIISLPSYNNKNITPIVAREILTKFKKSKKDSKFITDNISLLDDKIFDKNFLINHKNITDAYLVGLAYKNKMKLATLDNGINNNYLADKKAKIVEYVNL